MNRLGVWCVVLIGAVGLPASTAAEPRFRMVTLDAAYVAYERDVADVNGDGANDVVCVSEDEEAIRAYLAPDWRKVLLVKPAGEFTWPRADDFKAPDLDGDGDADLVVRLGPARGSEASGIAAWFENRGAAGWQQHTIGPSSGYVKDMCVADLDRDGRPDVVMRQDSQTQIYFQEKGSWTTVTVPHSPHEGLEVADLDMDGRPDLVMNGFWFPTPATPAAARVAANYQPVTMDDAWFKQSGDWTANSCKVVVGDFDGDGRNDVALSQSERAGHAVTWYGSPTPRVAGSWAKHPVAVVDFCHNLQAADWDGDGDIDLLVGGMTQSPHRGLKFLLNAGKGARWEESPLQSDGSYSAEVGDIDNDGDLDIVGVRNWNSPPSFIYRNEVGNRSTALRWTCHQVSASHVRTFGLCFPDIDGDGDLEIASGPFVYRNPGGSMTGAWEQLALPGGVHAFAALDVDGDKFADLLALRDNAAANRIDLFWVEAAGNGWAEPRPIGNVPRSDHALGFQGCRIAQLVAGGRPEVVVSSARGICFFTVPETDPAAGNWPRTVVARNDSDEGIGVGDLDGDGHLDIAFTSGRDKRVQWGRNPGRNGGTWEIATLGEFPEADWPDRCEVVDLNGDGRLDVVVTEENGGQAPDALACWWEQPAAGPRGPWARHTIATQYTMNSLDAADVDRDGDVDLVLAEHRGTKRIAVWLNDARGGFRESRVDEGRESHLGGRLVDLDGDGDLDLVSIAYDDFAKLHLWRNDRVAGPGKTVKRTSATSLAVPAMPAGVASGPSRPKSSPPPNPEHAATDSRSIAAPGIATNLAARWKLEQGTGARAADSSGQARHGTVTGAARPSGQGGARLAFDGVDDRVECGTWDLAGSAITMAAWIKPDRQFVDNDARILSKATGSQEQDHWWMLSTATVEGQRRLRVRIKAGGSTTTLIAHRGQIDLDTWTHVAATYDGASLRLFVNGVETGTASKSGVLDAGPTVPVWIGANPLNAYAPFRGWIGDVRVYQRALHVEEITALTKERPGPDGSQ